MHFLGFPSRLFGLHSLRSGGATAAANAGVNDRLFKVHLTPKFFFGRDETVQHSHKEFDNFISIW